VRNCFDEGKLQAWFDGALSAKETADLAAHVNLCSRCAETARTIEAENLIVAEGLAIEFAGAVPTERLRHRLDVAVAALHRVNGPAVSQSSWRETLESFVSFRPLAYAVIVVMVLFAGFFAFVFLKKETATTVIAGQPVPAGFPLIASELLKDDPMPATPLVPANNDRVRSSKLPVRGYQPDAMSLAWQENQYKYAIERLDEAIKVQPPMQTTAQVEYEYNLAVVNAAIATTRDAARKNPKDPQASQFLLSAYQNKVDLLNEIVNARGSEK
jgi:hypothetical protein